MKLFSWSIYEIGRTDAQSLLRFVNYYPTWAAKSEGGAKPTQRVYADQVELF